MTKNLIFSGSSHGEGYIILLSERMFVCIFVLAFVHSSTHLMSLTKTRGCVGQRPDNIPHYYTILRSPGIDKTYIVIKTI